MGCANSKPKGCQHCHCDTPYYSSVPRSFSVHVHHPPQSKGDSYHVVALTSTTLGSLDQVPHINHGNGLRLPSGKVIDSDSFRLQNDDDDDDEEEEVEEEKGKEESEAKTWSEMLEQMLPKAILKTPISTPPCEPETINTWELMEGLEDTSPFRSPKHFKSFSFDVNVKGHVDDPPKPRGSIENDNDSAKSIWPQKSEEMGSNGCSGLKASASDFDDPLVVVVSPSDESLQGSMAGKGFSIEEEKKICDDNDDDVVVVDLKGTPFRKDKVVLYFTSLRGVRKTYEDSCHVRLILKGLGLRVDERDVSMHSGFKEELKELLGHGYGKGGLGLPRVFIGRNYIGGAEDIQQLHEDGKLEKLLDCCEKIKDNVDDGEGVCEACGDVRFVPCETCYGSCKIYYEGYDDEEEEDDGVVGEYGFQRCPDCNENGLIRCPICCY